MPGSSLLFLVSLVDALWRGSVWWPVCHRCPGFSQRPRPGHVVGVGWVRGLVGAVWVKDRVSVGHVGLKILRSMFSPS